MIISTCNQYIIFLMKYFYIFFHTKSLKSGLCALTACVKVTFQVFYSCLQLGAALELQLKVIPHLT